MQRSILSISLIMALGSVAQADTRYVTAPSGTAVIAGPDTVFSTVDFLPRGARVDVAEFYEGYALINRPSGVQAWVRASALGRSAPVAKVKRQVVPQEPDPTVEAVDPYPSVVWTQSGPLNMRYGPGFRHAVMSQCQKGDWVEVIALAGDWSKVRLPSNKTGWVASEYLTR